MKAIKPHKTTYNALHLCLEAHFGGKRTTSTAAPNKYQEPDQGFCTILFQSHCPLQLDYMRRRKRHSLIRTIFGLINPKRNIAK
ncbi:MAG: hypothetical protein V5783_02905 [Pontiella sp.]